MSILVVSWVMLIRAALGVVAIIALFMSQSTLRAKILTTNSTAATTHVDYLAFIGGYLVGALTVSMFYGILAVRIRQGTSEARTYTLALAVFSVCVGPLSFLIIGTAFTRGVNLVGAVLAAIVISLLLRRDSSRYLSATR